MTKLTSVDVVIPTVGRESLARAIDSVRAQAGVTVKLHVVCDDPTQASRVRSLVTDGELLESHGAGGAAARNIGLRASESQFVAYLDDDDWWEPRKLTIQVEEALRTGRSLTLCGAVFHEEGGTERSVPRQPPGDRQVGDYAVQRPRLKFGDGLVQSSCFLVNRSVSRPVEWNERLSKHQDWGFAMDIADDDQRVAFVSDPLVHIQQGSNRSISRTHAWVSSAAWLENYQDRLTKRSRGDFVSTHVLRAALATGDASGARSAIRALRSNPPHLAALVVGATGAAHWFRNGRKGH